MVMRKLLFCITLIKIVGEKKKFKYCGKCKKSSKEPPFLYFRVKYAPDISCWVCQIHLNTLNIVSDQNH